MRNAGNRELLDYWKRLKGERSAPERTDIDPGAIRSLLADVFILEFDARRGLPFRVAGGRTNALFGRELRGRSFLELWTPDDREDVLGLAGAALDEARPVVIAGLARPTDHAALAIETLLLPLRHNGQTHARLLGAFTPCAAPSWIGLTEIEEVNYVTSRVINDNNEAIDENVNSIYDRFDFAANTTVNRRKQFYVISRP
jgi:hypothetical protein